MDEERKDRRGNMDREEVGKSEEMIREEVWGEEKERGEKRKRRQLGMSKMNVKGQ